MVKLTQTHKIFSYEPYSLNYSVLKAAHQGWTIHQTHEILSYDPSSLNYSIVHAVQQGWSTSNSYNILLQIHNIYSYDSYSLNYSVFKAVQQGRTIHQTHEMFSYNPCSRTYSAVRAVRLNGTTLNSWNIVLRSFFSQLLTSSSSSTGLNYIELMKYSSMILVLSITRLFAQFGWIALPQTHETFS